MYKLYNKKFTFLLFHSIPFLSLYSFTTGSLVAFTQKFYKFNIGIYKKKVYKLNLKILITSKNNYLITFEQFFKFLVINFNSKLFTF